MKPLKQGLLAARERLGDIALLSLAILGAGTVFLLAAVRPLEVRLERLDKELSRAARAGAADSARSGSPAARLATFYAYFEREESQVDWLAKLYASAQAAGLELRSADYRLVEDNGRVARYEITLPLAGSYAQLRAFLANALDRNPVLSLDQLTLRRKRVNDSAIEAEALLTIHLLRP